MTAPDHPPSSGRRRWEALAPLVLLFVRLFLPIATPFYLDWITVLCIYWILFVFFSKSRAFDVITAVAALTMLAIYLSRTIPTLMDTLRFCL